MDPEQDLDLPERIAAASPTRANAALAQSLLAASSARKSQVFQRRLKAKISESRALELLDRRIKSDRVPEFAAIDSNQEQDEELVCDSTMVRFNAPEEIETHVCGLLKTVRKIHRQRGHEHETPTLGPTENQRS